MSEVNVLVRDVADHAKSFLDDLLQAGKLTKEEFDLVARCCDRLATYALLGPIVTPEQRRGMERAANLDLSALANIAVAKELQLEDKVRNAVLSAIRSALNMAIRYLAPVITG